MRTEKESDEVSRVYNLDKETIQKVLSVFSNRTTKEKLNAR